VRDSRSPRPAPTRGYDGFVSDPEPTTDSSRTPGERRLSRPPSERYREAEEQAAEAAARASVDASASVARGVVLAVVVAVVGAVAIVVLGGILTETTGLVAVAGVMGFGIGLALRWGAGTRLVARRRVAIAVGLSLLAVAVAQLGLWQNARVEGGVLSPLDYLWEVYGPLVAIELAVAGGLAWLVTR
jgi:hypothetical protein